MFNVIEYEGKEYSTKKNWYGWDHSNKYIRFEWDNGFLDMRKYDWDKLPKRKKKLVYDLMKGR